MSLGLGPGRFVEAGHPGLPVTAAAPRSCAPPCECRRRPADATLGAESKTLRQGRRVPLLWVLSPTPRPQGQQRPAKTAEPVALKTTDHQVPRRSADARLEARIKNHRFSPPILRIKTRDKARWPRALCLGAAPAQQGTSRAASANDLQATHEASRNAYIPSLYAAYVDAFISHVYFVFLK